MADDTYIHLSMGGPDRKIVDQNGETFTFEDHPRFGPIVLNKRGDPAEKQPGERASFWRVHAWWLEQGKQISQDGVCIWKEPQPMKLEHMGGRHYRIIHD